MLCLLFQSQSEPVVFDIGCLKALVHVVSNLFSLARDTFDRELGRNETKIVICFLKVIQAQDSS